MTTARYDPAKVTIKIGGETIDTSDTILGRGDRKSPGHIYRWSTTGRSIVSELVSVLSFNQAIVFLSGIVIRRP